MAVRIAIDDPSNPRPAFWTWIRRAPIPSPRLAFGLIGVLALADLFSKGATMPVVYAVPLILLVRAGFTSHLRSVALLLIVLAYGVYFAKQVLKIPTPAAADPFDFRLVNRTFAAVMLGALAVLLKLRASTQSPRADLKHPELESPVGARADEERSEATVALLIGAALTVEIAIADILSPANYNLAILYMVPLFLCAWTRRRSLLWGMLAATLILNPVGYVLGLTSDYVLLWWGIPVNRVLTALVMTFVTALLHFRIDTVVPAAAERSKPATGSGQPA